MRLPGVKAAGLRIFCGEGAGAQPDFGRTNGTSFTVLAGSCVSLEASTWRVAPLSGGDGDAGYSEGVTTEGGDTGSKRSRPPRRFGQLPGLVVPDDFDEPLADEDWPIEEADCRAVLESEADIAADRTLGEEEIGLPRSDTGGQSSP